MTNFQITEEVLTAYLKGELATAEAAAVEAWYDVSAKNRQLLGEVYYLLFINDRIQAAEAVDVDRALRQFKTRMQARRHAPMLRLVRRAVAVAAVVALFIAGSMVTSSVAERMAKPVTVVTQLGERSQVVLPDGTKVWLNSSSRVEYSSPLFSRQRRVTLDGEAYFEVSPDKHAPFIVTTNGLDVKVIGTKFNIRDDDEQQLVTTVLLEGAVLAYASDNERNAIRLRPSQMLMFDCRTQQMRLKDTGTASQSIDWIQGRLTFNRHTFTEIASELKRYYNVDLHFVDKSLMQERFSGDFKIEDGIYHIMSVLQLTYKFHYKVDGNNDIQLYAN